MCVDVGCRSKTEVQEHMRERAGGMRGQGPALSRGQRLFGRRLERACDKPEPELDSHKQGQVLAADMMMVHRSWWGHCKTLLLLQEVWLLSLSDTSLEEGRTQGQERAHHTEEQA